MENENIQQPVEEKKPETPVEMPKRMTETDLKEAKEKMEEELVKPVNPLEPIHEAFYAIVEENTLAGNPPLTQRQVVDEVNLRMELAGEEDRLFYTENDSNHCRRIWDLVQDINASPEKEKVICVYRYTYYLGNEFETEWYRCKLRSDAIKKLVRASRVSHKQKQNSQGKFIDVKGHVLELDIVFTETYPKKPEEVAE